MPWSKPKASSSKRGYGAEHRRIRAKWQAVVDRGEVSCCLCGQPIAPGSRWHLDHTPDRTGYRGPAHVGCNQTDGARRARAKQNKTQINW